MLSLGMRPMNASVKLSHLTSKHVYLCDVLQLMQLTAYIVYLAPNWVLNAYSFLSLGMRPMNASLKLSHLTSKYVYLCDVLQLMQFTAYLVHLAPNWVLNAKVHTYHREWQVNESINNLTFK